MLRMLFEEIKRKHGGKLSPFREQSCGQIEPGSGHAGKEGNQKPPTSTGREAM